MMQYRVVELEDGSKRIIIDTIQYKGKDYFLLTEVSPDEECVDDEFEIYFFNPISQSFDEEIDEETYNLMKRVFEKRVDLHKQEMELFNNINFDKMQKLRVIRMNNYHYVLQKENGSMVVKHIGILGNNKLPIDCYIYMSEKIVKERNIFTYGDIYDYNNINEDEIIKLKTKDYVYYLQRYYG